MKKILQLSLVVLILATFAFSTLGCSKDPVDKMLDKYENLIDEGIKASESKDEVKQTEFMKHLGEFIEEHKDIEDQEKWTDKQKDRYKKLEEKGKKIK